MTTAEIVEQSRNLFEEVKHLLYAAEYLLSAAINEDRKGNLTNAKAMLITVSDKLLGIALRIE